MDTYKGVALGVECAWPALPIVPKAKAPNKRRWPIGLALVLATILLAACGGLTTADCGPDWYSIGQRDGRLGAQPQAEFYAGRCSAGVDSASYLRGWQDGLRTRPIPTS